MKEFTIVCCSKAYKFNGVLLGKKRNEEMYKTDSGKYIVFESAADSEGVTIMQDDKALLSSHEPQWIKWANLDFPDDLVVKL